MAAAAAATKSNSSRAVYDSESRPASVSIVTNKLFHTSLGFF
ncbi:MAG: hypothetical protein MHMPM18_000256 [Marteilia pararefringens]